MRPYLAVIADSFHSALSSRILWIAFVAIWIFLAALAPIGYHEDYTTTFRWFDLDNGTQMKAMLARGLVDPEQEKTALGRIARTFPDEIQRNLEQVAKGEDVRIDKSALADSLNESIDDESWYDAEAWKTTVRLRELRELDEIADDEISEDERRRRARLRIEAALPGVFSAQAARSITLSYAGFDFPAFFAIGKSQFVSLINQFVVPVMMDWLLGFALIFLGILVTASIIPEMLQPGSLHLLLSKPVSRTLLLLSKFIGGCAFVFLCVCQLVIGLWLIAGFRLDIWNVRILWCIPVAVFLFAVFFSVSLLAGLRWRSPILSIGVTCLFGAFVLIIGFIGGYFDGLVQGPDRISQLAMDGEDIITTTRGGALRRLDVSTETWEDVIESDFGSRDLIVPPVRIGSRMIATAKVRNGRFNSYGSGSLDLLVLDGNSDWEPKPGMRLPNGTRRLFVTDNQLIVLNNTGLLVAPLDEAIEESGLGEDQEVDPKTDDKAAGENTEDDPESSEDSKTDFSKIGQTAWIKDLLRMQGGATEQFRSVMPSGIALTEPFRVRSIPATRQFIVYSRGRLMRMVLPKDSDGQSETLATIEKDILMEDNDAARTAMATSQNSVLLIREDEPIRWLNNQTLETIAQRDVPEGQTILSVVGLAAEDRYVILTSDGEAELVWRDGDSIVGEAIAISDVTAITVDPATDQLLVAHHIDRIDVMKLDSDGESFQTVRTVRPALSSWRWVDRFVITPIRTVIPQTGELSQTVAALVSGKSSFAIGGGEREEQEVIRLRMARPVISCGAFIIVMLSISCLYFARRDF